MISDPETQQVYLEPSILNRILIFDMKNIFLKLLLFSLLYGSLLSCRSLEENAKYGLSDGVYRFKTQASKVERVYIQVEEDSLIIYPMLGRGIADISQTTVLELKETGAEARKDYLIFTQPSFDIDIVTILFKYRPKVEDGPRQFNTDFNGAVYLGYRADRYSIDYEPTPLQSYKRKLNHFGYGAGFFTGIGATMIAPWFTRDHVQSEYDGLVFVNGISGNVAYNSLTFGVGIGIDYLMDSNRKYWVYQGKPWLGLTLGLNLN